LRQALKLSEKEGMFADQARVFTALGQIARDQGRLDEALAFYQQAAEIYRSNGPELKYAHTVRHIADIHLDNQAATVAEPLFNEALAIYRADPTADSLDLANAIRGTALAKVMLGKLEEGQALIEEARGLYERLGVEAGVAEMTRALTKLADK